MNSWFFRYKAEREANDIDNLWNIFEVAIQFADNESEEAEEKFNHEFDIVRKQSRVKWNITMGLYWIRPYFYLNLDGKNREYILNKRNGYSDIAEISNLKKFPDAKEYLKLLDYFKKKFNDGKSSHKSFPELSYDAWNFSDEEEPESEKNGVNNGTELESYTEKYFLNEVFMNQNSYRKLVKILKLKKNLIIQGPPGVGKTFSAKRLAYSMMGEIDESRVQMVQFHQSYSYEDFIMGYRPTESGFKLATGAFYDFCKQAEKDGGQEYFFIIDEINRGNLSQIFGELLMLIENDKRGQELRLIYKDELFSVPKNLYIIGMMNTADRSLAIIDYALRRRFAFYNLKPGFDSEGFKEIIKDRNNSKFNAVVEQLKKLNKEISEDVTLGSGFQIGHSYLCSDEIATDEWLTVIIDYELLPLLEEYWFDEPDKLKQWKNNLLGVLNDQS